MDVETYSELAARLHEEADIAQSRHAHRPRAGWMAYSQGLRRAADELEQVIGDHEEHEEVDA